jgi:hypothetical protein
MEFDHVTNRYLYLDRYIKMSPYFLNKPFIKIKILKDVPGLEIGRKAGVTGRQGMLTLHRLLIPPLVFPGIRASLILTADLSLFLTGRIDFDCRFISSPDWAD